MPPDVNMLLEDMRRALELIEQFARGRSREDYHCDAMLRAAVERQFEIVGEALAQLYKLDPAFADQIPERRKIISFRNILVHAYFRIDNDVVWDVVERDVVNLKREVEVLLRGPGSAQP